MAVSPDYSAIIKRSWEITKKYKWLWVYGFLVAAAGSSSGGNGGGSSNRSSDTIKDLPKEIPKDLPEKTSYVLGQATDLIKDWFTSVPITTWIFLGLVVLASIILGTIIMWIVRSWAKGSLIAGVNMADKNEVVTLKTTSPKGVAKIKHLIILGLISFGLTVGTFFAGMIPFLLGFALLGINDTVGKIWMGLWAFLFIISFIIIIVIFTMTSMYAERLIVLKNYAPWDAWKKGLSFSKHHFLPTSIMGIINSILGCSVGCVSTLALLIVFAIPGVLLAIPLFSGKFSTLSLFSIAGLIFLFLVFIAATSIVNAAFAVFKFSNWNLFFAEVIKYEEKV